MEHGVAAATMHDPAARGHSPDDAASCSASTMSTETTPATTAGTPTDAPTVQKICDIDVDDGLLRYRRPHGQGGTYDLDAIEYHHITTIDEEGDA